MTSWHQGPCLSDMIACSYYSDAALHKHVLLPFQHCRGRVVWIAQQKLIDIFIKKSCLKFDDDIDDIVASHESFTVYMLS